MKTLYEQLNKQVKTSLKESNTVYKSGPRKVIAELHRFNNYSELTISTVNELCLYGDVDTYSWDVIDWKYGEKIFDNQ